MWSQDLFVFKVCVSSRFARDIEVFASCVSGFLRTTTEAQQQNENTSYGDYPFLGDWVVGVMQVSTTMGLVVEFQLLHWSTYPPIAWSMPTRRTSDHASDIELHLVLLLYR